jgi:predicted NACHT family NTPase
MTWVPRVHLSGFDDQQVTELVSKWLEKSNSKIEIFFQQLENSQSLKEMMTVPLLATLIVLVFKQTGKLPENKTRLYEIFVDLHNGGWDLVKSVQRPSHFSATEKMFILKRIAASIHKAKRREMLETDISNVARDTLRDSNWKVLRSELLRDGLIVQMGSMMGFAHHSFQEFLTAKHLLGDLDISYVAACCDEYLAGSDWWQEVLYFYIDLAGKPQETLRWIDEQLKPFIRFSGAKSIAARERALLLKQHLTESFPYAKC